MSNPSRFFSIPPDETGHILLPGSASLGLPKLPTLSLELASLAQFALSQRQSGSCLLEKIPGSSQGTL